ncbi:hypothetical protein DIPPA_13373 [Diplonema papillatum]|nr:hypothetical protein DIPPA_13373 [Diplonema papillatum]KAJ9458273.1 hypothetical protein DIPPA_13373 [Diplonema papillatum]
MAPKKKPAGKRTSPPPQSGSIDGSAAVPRVQDEDAVIRPSNEDNVEKALNAKEELNAEKEELKTEQKKLNADKDTLNADKDKLNAKKDTLNADKDKLNAKEDKLNAEKEALIKLLVDCLKAAGKPLDSANHGIYNGSNQVAKGLADRITRVQEDLSLVLKERSLVQEQLLQVQTQLTKLVQPVAQVASLAEFDFKSGGFRSRISDPKSLGFFHFQEFQCTAWEGKAQIEEEARECVKEVQDKQKRSILLVPSGMGTGKSRTLTEIPKIVTAQLPQGSRLYQLQVTFENATGIRRDEIGEDRVAKAPKAVIDRVMHHLFGTDVQFDVFRRREWNFTLAELVSKIMKALNNYEDAFLFVCIDGVHHLDVDGTVYLDKAVYGDAREQEQWYQQSALRAILLALRETMLSCKRVMCAASSTLFLPLQKVIEGSQTLKKALITPPTLDTVPTEVQNKLVLAHKDYFLEIFGEHPRSMESLLRVTAEDLPELLLQCTVNLADKYQAALDTYDDFRVTALLRHAFSGNCNLASPVGDRTLDDMMSLGLMSLKGAKLSVSPALLLLLWMRKEPQLDILSSWRPMTCDTGSRAFERFVGFVLTVRSKVFAGERVQVSTFLSGVNWLSGDIARSNVKLSPLKLVKATHQLATRSDLKCGRVNTGKGDGSFKAEDLNDDIPIKGYCVINADQAPAGDVFQPLGNQHLVVQCKHGEAGVGDSCLPKEGITYNFGLSTCAGDTYLLATKKTVGKELCDDLVQEAKKNKAHLGLVDAENFKEFFGPFSPFFVPGKKGSKRQNEDALSEGASAKKQKTEGTSEKSGSQPGSKNTKNTKKRKSPQRANTIHLFR